MVNGSPNRINLREVPPTSECTERDFCSPKFGGGQNHTNDRGLSVSICDKETDVVLSSASRWNLRLAEWPPLCADESKINKTVHCTTYLMRHGLRKPEFCSL
jgi:hypothetical protein